MSTILYESPVFGPVKSRRLGVSLGINLMPADGKICTFNCIYCECGLNEWHRPTQGRPTALQVRECVEERLAAMKKRGEVLNVLTFAGNGEPTAHPEFPMIVEDIRSLRDRYFPEAGISVLSNATRITDKRVFDALLRVDNNIQKLDTVNMDYIMRVDAPAVHYDLKAIVKTLKAFEGHVNIQTLFMTGTDSNGESVDNTGPEYVEPWIKTVKDIAPKSVMVYTIDRETPVNTLRKASPAVLDSIVERLEKEGIKASASY